MAPLNLDDVALRILQLDPEDRMELGRARAQLIELALTNGIAIAAQPLVAGAVRALTPLVDGTAEDPPAAMREVGRLLQDAVDAAPPLLPMPLRPTAVAFARP